MRPIVFFIGILVVISVFSSVMMYVALFSAFEKAVFSAHVSLTSSGDLVRGEIVRINLTMGTVMILAGVLVLLLMRLFMEKVLAEFAQGVQKLAQGETAFRLSPRRRLIGGDLADCFNRLACELDKRSGVTMKYLNEAVNIVQGKDKDHYSKLNDLHRKISKTFPCS